MTREMLKVLTEFHHREAQQITGMTAKRGAGGKWEYTAIEEAMDLSHLESTPSEYT